MVSCYVEGVDDVDLENHVPTPGHVSIGRMPDQRTRRKKQVRFLTVRVQLLEYRFL